MQVAKQAEILEQAFVFDLFHRVIQTDIQYSSGVQKFASLSQRSRAKSRHLGGA